MAVAPFPDWQVRRLVAWQKEKQQKIKDKRDRREEREKERERLGEDVSLPSNELIITGARSLSPAGSTQAGPSYHREHSRG